MMSKIYILSIETATAVCSVSLSLNGQAHCRCDAPEINSHARSLTVLMQDCLDQAGISFADLSAVSVSMGPGSYTGLRIGVSAAKGLCYALGVPLIGINSLDAMAAGYSAKFAVANEQQMLCPMIDARRQEVYTAFYSSDLQTLHATEALIVDEQSFDSYLEKGFQVTLFGSGADKFVPLFDSHPGIHIQPEFETSAEFQDQLAFQKFQAQEFEDVAYFEPFYLKDFVATKSKKNLLS